MRQTPWRLLPLICLVLAWDAPTKAQDAAAILFSKDHILNFGLSISSQDIATLDTSTPAGDVKRPVVPATFIFEGKTYAVEVKLKGQLGSFRSFDSKPAFKIKFIHDRFFGLKHLTLNNMNQDPTLVNEAVVYPLYTAAGAPAPRTGYANLSINGENFGLYLNLETEDKQFLARVFGNSDGNLYEGFGDFEPQDMLGWDQEEGSDISRNDLAAFAAKLTTASADEFFYGASPILNTPAFLAMLAVEVLSGDPDGYGTGTNNFRFYHDVRHEQWIMIPAGRDRAFETSLRPFDGRALLKQKCYESARCLADYSQKLNEVAQLMHSTKFVDAFDSAVRLINVAGINDPRSLHTPAETRLARQSVRNMLVNAPTKVDLPLTCEVIPINGKEFGFCPLPKNFADAEASCAAIGMHLTSYETPQIMTNVDTEALRHFNEWWIGLSNVTTTSGGHASGGQQIDPFVWTANGKTPTFTAWYPGEPNNWNGEEHCGGVVFKDGQPAWNDLPCRTQLAHVCRR